MNPIELKVARMRRNITGKEAAKALGLTIDGYFKKEHGTAKITLSEAYILTKLYQLTLTEFVNIFCLQTAGERQSENLPRTVLHSFEVLPPVVARVQRYIF